MAEKFFVRASVMPGHNHYFRAGRGWTVNPVEIELIDADDSPKVKNTRAGLPDVPHPTQVGRRDFAILEKDARISIKPANQETADAMAAKFPALQLEVESLRAKLAEAQAASAKAAGLHKSVVDERDSLKEQLLKANGKLAELEASLEELTKPSAKKPKPAKDEKPEAPKADPAA